MILCEWKNVPENMKNEEVKKYYDFLANKKWSLFLKRGFDLLMSIILLIILSPVFLFVAVWIKIDSKGPIFYRQERITQYGRKFKIVKFRTMIVDADKKGALVTTSNDSRITKVGCKIRKARVDEIPQLINILKGEMSFVGTRPEVKKYVDYYTDEMKATLLLPAGVTSLASITFKDEDEIILKYENQGISIDEIYVKFLMQKKMIINLKYMKQFNIYNDLMICIKTIIL